MFDIITELFVGFGLDKYPQTLSELIPWLICVFISIMLVLYILNGIFIIAKAFGRKGGN